MATHVTSPAPTAPAPAPEEPIVQRAAKDIAKAKTGNDLLRPLRYTKAFIDGTFEDGLDGMAHWGRQGMFVGMGLGVIAGIALSALIPAVVVGTAIGLALGAGGGAAMGFATGGARAVGRIHRGEAYAEDLIVRKKVQDTATPNRNDFRDAYNAQQRRDAINNQQAIERYKENTRDFNTYWEDRERERRHHAQQQQGGLGY